MRLSYSPPPPASRLKYLLSAIFSSIRTAADKRFPTLSIRSTPRTGNKTRLLLDVIDGPAPLMRYTFTDFTHETTPPTNRAQPKPKRQRSKTGAYRFSKANTSTFCQSSSNSRHKKPPYLHKKSVAEEQRASIVLSIECLSAVSFEILYTPDKRRNKAIKRCSLATHNPTHQHHVNTTAIRAEIPR